MADDVVAAYAAKLFVRSEAEIRRPAVLLSGERTNVYGVLEKHFRETALPPSERFWRTVRMQWTPQLDTWRPRVNGVQLKVLAGARLPESEAEWAALRTALESVRQHLRADTTLDRLHAELRDFVAMVVAWWENRKKTEGGNGTGCGGGGGVSMSMSGFNLMKRVASSGLLMGGGVGGGMPPYVKKQCMEFMQLQPAPPPPQQYHQPVYAAPEIVQHTLLGLGGSGRLPDRALSPVGEQQQAQAQQQQHGGTGYLQHLTNSDAQLFGDLFQGVIGGGASMAGGMTDGACGGGSGGSGSQSPHVQQLHQEAAAAAAVLLPVPAPAGGAEGYYPQSPRDRQEGSADNVAKSPTRPPASAGDGKRFVTLNVGGHRFLTTAATLGAVEGTYFSKLAQQAGSGRGGEGGSEFFVDRSGKIFEYVLDYLRSQRFSDSASNLPRDERTLHLLAREADFYQLPDLAERARAAHAAAAAAAALTAAAMAPMAEDTPSDMPANIAAEGSAHGGQMMLGRFGINGGGAAAAAALAALQQPQLLQQQQASLLDAIFVETGFQPAGALAVAQAALLDELNGTVQGKQAEGFAVVEYKCGAEREGATRNLYYHVLLRKAGAA